MKFRQFQHLGEEGKFFSALAEVVERHTGASGYDAAFLAERIWNHGILNRFRVYDRSKDVEALSRLDRAIAEVQRVLADGAMTNLARETLSTALFWGPHFGASEERTIYKDSEEGKALIEYLENYGKRDNTVLTEIEDRGREIRYALGKAIEQIEASPLAKTSATRINADGIGLVDATRFIWKLATNKEPPSKDLNPASKFGLFLADVFDVCGQEGDPRSSFRAWVKEQI